MILDTVEDAGLSMESVTRGLGATEDELKDPRARIDWDVFVEFLERVETAGRGVMTAAEIGERMVRAPSFEFIRRIGRLAMSPRRLYTIANRLVVPALFANLILTTEWLPSGELVMSAELLSGYRESATFFRLAHGNVVATPRVFDLPPATVHEEIVSGRRGRLVLGLPDSRTLGARARRVVSATRGLRRTWRTMRDLQREVDASLASARRSRNELQQLLERLPDGVLIHDEGVVLWANAALLQSVGVGRLEDLRGRRTADFFTADGDEYVVACADRVRRVQPGATQDVDFEGARARLVVLRDVTEQRKMREQVAISDRLASIGALAAGVAHEINNPLAYARLNLEIASRQATTSDLRAALGLAREGTDQALRIVRELKMLSRLANEPSEAVDLPALLDVTFSLAGRALTDKARVMRAYGPTPLAFGPRSRLAQVFLNLLSNAADAIPPGAAARHVIRAKTGTDERGRAFVEIHDTGGGIPPEIAPRVFDAFFTTKPVGVGTGLGLAVCHRIVTELGGEITFESAPGDTRFRVALPAATPPS